MAKSLQRESSRLSSAKGSTIGSDKHHPRPSLISRAYNTVSYGGGKRDSYRLSKISTNTSEADGGAGSRNLKSFNGVFATPEPECRPIPPHELTADQQKKYVDMLEYFQRTADFPASIHADNTDRAPPSDWEKLRMLSKESLLRYLRASKWDLTHAKKRLTDTIAWRREFGVDDLDADEMAKEAQSGKETVLGYDKKCRPLHYMHPHRNDTKESPRQMQFAVWILERCIDLMPPGVEQLALLINFDHKSRNPTSIANAKLMLYILQNHYVERLGIALCINVPWVFKLFWNAIQAFIDPNTKSKCKFDEAIKDEVPLGQLSAEFGGELDAKYNHEKYWPDLVKLSSERRKEMLRRFKEDCNSEIGASEWIIRGGDDESSPFHHRKRQGAPSELTTTSKSSEMGTVESQSGEKAREAAVLASVNRHGEATASPIDEEPELMTPATPMEKFQTPSSFLNSSPLDIVFSTHTSGMTSSDKGEGGEASLTAQAEVLAESSKRNSTEMDTKPGRRHDRESSGASSGWHHFEEEMSKGFKDFNHKLHGAFTNSGSRRSSQERKQKKEKSVDDGKEKRRSKLRDSTVEADRRENVENTDGMTSTSKVPSAQEAAAIAGAAGVTGAVGAVDGAAAEGLSGNTSTETTLQGDQYAEKKKILANGITNQTTSKTIHVLYFAAAKEAVGSGKEDVDLPELPFALSKLGEYLSEMMIKRGKGDVAAFQSVLEKSRWSVNEDMIDDEEVGKLMLQGGEDVAIIPPVSGG